MTPVLTDSTSWAFRNKIAYRQPVGWVLLGVFGEGSGFHPNQVYIWTLVMPLYVESENLILSYSQRVASAGTFGLEDEDLPVQLPPPWPDFHPKTRRCERLQPDRRKLHPVPSLSWSEVGNPTQGSDATSWPVRNATSAALGSASRHQGGSGAAPDHRLRVAYLKLNSYGPLTIASASAEFGDLRGGMGLLNPQQPEDCPIHASMEVAQL